MKGQMIITIGRCFGSNGREIGDRLARELGLGFYDRNLIDLAAKKAGIERSVAGNADEKLIGMTLPVNSNHILFIGQKNFFVRL